jgi:hypothetical protein
MISERKRAANRRNALASTGPKTAAGKARVAQNARRHGLSVAVADDSLARDAEALGRAICGGERRAICGDGRRRTGRQNATGRYGAADLPGRLALDGPHPDRLHLAREIAHAQIDIARVRRARHELIAQALADPNYRSPRGLRARIAMLARVGEMAARGVPIPPELREAIAPCPLGPQKLVLILADLAGELAAMDRYERRALSRRKSAIRKFDGARAARQGSGLFAEVERAMSPPSAFWQNKASAPRRRVLPVEEDSTSIVTGLIE